MKKWIFVVNCIAIIFTFVILSIALDHNPMGEYYEYVEGPAVNGIRKGSFQWDVLFTLGITTFLFIALPMNVLVAIISFIQKWWLRKENH